MGNSKDDIKSPLIFNPDSQIIVHGFDGPFVMDRNKWPTLNLPEEVEPLEGLTQEDSLTADRPKVTKETIQAYQAREPRGRSSKKNKGVASEEDIMDSLSNLSNDSEMDKMSQGWLSPRPRKSKKKKSKKVVVATRTSQRVPKDGMSITERVTSRAMAKNSIAGNNMSSNPFTVLSNTPPLMLQEVLIDLDIVGDNIEEQIGVFQAEERARVALAEANYKVFLEKTKR